MGRGKKIFFAAVFAFVWAGTAVAAPLLTLGARGHDVRIVQEALQKAGYAIEGVTGVYQRQFRKGELELDVVSDKTAEDLASILSDRGCEIDGVSGALVEGRGAEAPAP